MKNSKSELPIIGKRSKKINNKLNEEKKEKKKKKKSKSRSKNETKENFKEEQKQIEIPPINDIYKIDPKNKKIENLIEECGIPMAFNVIFSELITKQIMPENFFKYTSLRLKELGKEIQGLKVKEPVYIERLNEKIPEKRLKTEGDKVIKNGNLFMTEQQGKKKDIKLNDVDKYD